MGFSTAPVRLRSDPFGTPSFTTRLDPTRLGRSASGVVSAVPLGLATGGSVALLHWLGRRGARRAGRRGLSSFGVSRSMSVRIRSVASKVAKDRDVFFCLPHWWCRCVVMGKVV